MRVDMNSSALIQGSLMQGRFSSSQINNTIKNKDGNVEKQSPSNLMSTYDKMVENIKEQMKKVQENDKYDADTKKAKLEELKSQIEDVRKAEQEENMKKMQNKMSGKSEDDKITTNENSDGDKLTISDEMKELIKNDSELDKKEQKNAMKKELEGSSTILKSEIEADKSRGVNTEKKEKQLTNLRERVKALEENELEKITVSEDDQDTNSNKHVNNTVKAEDDKKAKEDNDSKGELQKEFEV